MSQNRRAATGSGGGARPIALALCLAALLAACGRPGPPRTYPARPGATERGIASWYGPGFHGRQTANGEVYDMRRMTAAHKTLPFDTVVEVENLSNGRRVRVRINDRGPFVRGRVIDLSRAAAEEIGLIGPGTAPVRLRVVDAGPVPAAGAWRIQVGAFREARRAVALVERLDRDGFGATVVTSGGWHRVLLGPFKTRTEAEETRRKLRRRGFDGIVRGAA